MKTTVETRNPIRIYTDGAGQRPDGKGSGIAWFREDTGRRYVEKLDGLTNNESECRAVISAVEALDPGDEAQVFLDSELIAYQFNGTWRTADPSLLDLHSRLRAVIAAKRLKITLTWVPRNKNLAGKMI